MATHSSVLSWRIPGMGEPGGLPSMGSQSRRRLKRLSSRERDPSAGDERVQRFKSKMKHGWNKERAEATEGNAY